jgi:EAL domain-containing protein (putative c-di-GMP-specific phosphodiesterase class I)
LDVFYQPLVSNADTTIVSVEALVRWQHPQFGLLWPSQFLSIAEETGLIIPLGEWMLEQACRALRDWPPGISIALNVSPVQLRDPSFTERFLLIVRASGADPDRIQLEITESAIVNADATIIAALHMLRRSGMKIALDDLGTGYSSLTKLRGLEFDKVKIDRSFIKHLGQSGDSAAIINAFAEIGRSLGLTVTAEGVETEEQRERLLASGCTELQGFLFSHPVPYDEVSKLIGGLRTDRQVA